MADRPSFQQRQLAFAAHIRDPKNVPAPEGIEERRMAIYRELFFNNLRNLLGTTYPVVKKLSGDAGWRRLIRLFMKQHRAETPYFLQLPSEFLAFLQDEYELQDDDFPFLLELAHYEYMELALATSTDDNDLTDVDPDADLLDNIPVKSKLAWVFAYQFPVHRIDEEYTPDEPAEQPVYLAMYRRPDDSIGFMELNPVTAALLNAVENNVAQQSGRQLLEALAAQINYPDLKAFVEHGAQALIEMRDNDILTGARAAG